MRNFYELTYKISVLKPLRTVYTLTFFNNSCLVLTENVSILSINPQSPTKYLRQALVFM